MCQDVALASTTHLIKSSRWNQQLGPQVCLCRISKVSPGKQHCQMCCSCIPVGRNAAQALVASINIITQGKTESVSKKDKKVGKKILSCFHSIIQHCMHCSFYIQTVLQDAYMHQHARCWQCHSCRAVSAAAYCTPGGKIECRCFAAEQ